MNDFRRAYEYDDEQGVAGLLLIFFIMLISFDLVAAIVTFTQSSAVIRAFTSLNVVYVVLWLVYFAIKLLFLIALFIRRKIVISFARTFLFIRLGIFTFSILITYFLVIQDPRNSPINITDGLFSAWDIAYVLCLGPLLYTILFSIGWWYYFKRSARVRNYYSK